jgi:hypothetical protein
MVVKQNVQHAVWRAQEAYIIGFVRMMRERGVPVPLDLNTLAEIFFRAYGEGWRQLHEGMRRDMHEPMGRRPFHMANIEAILHAATSYQAIMQAQQAQQAQQTQPTADSRQPTAQPTADGQQQGVRHQASGVSPDERAGGPQPTVDVGQPPASPGPVLPAEIVVPSPVDLSQLAVANGASLPDRLTAEDIARAARPVEPNGAR